MEDGLLVHGSRRGGGPDSEHLEKTGNGAGDPSLREYLRVNLNFYGVVVLAMLFFWEWFWTLNPDKETGEAVTSHMVYFPIMDALFVVVALSTGRYLWKAASEIRE